MLRRLIRHLRSPIRVALSFDEKAYKLGETIDVTVELTPRRDLAVSRARVDLICEERYAESYTKETPLRYKTGVLKRTEAELIDIVPEQVVKEFKESLVHSSQVIVEDRDMTAKKVATFGAKLPIQREPPPHASGGTLKWTIAAVAEVDGEESASTPQKIEVTVG